MRFFGCIRHPDATTWRPWFAWRPVWIRPGDGTTGPLVWLEIIETRSEYAECGFGSFTRRWYRLPAPAQSNVGEGA